MHPTLSAAIRRTRQHHAIEHATIHLLTARFPGQRFSGLSDAFGFTIYADVDEMDLRRAVDDAISRMRAGEASLAIHPNCGTNLATTALLATGAALTGSRCRGLLERLATSLLLVLAALVVAKPLGYRLQGYTTLADVDDRHLADIRLMPTGGNRIYRVFFV